MEGRAEGSWSGSRKVRWGAVAAVSGDGGGEVRLRGSGASGYILEAKPVELDRVGERKSEMPLRSQ